MTRAIRVLFAILIGFSAAGQAGDTNLIVNGTFDADVSGWSPGGDATIEWASMDADGDPGSGSALVTNTADDTGSRGVFASCISPVEGGKEYSLRSSVFTASGQEVDGNGFVSIWLYDEPNCQGDQVLSNFGSQVYTSTPDQWLESRLFAHAPASAQSVRVAVSVNKDEAQPGLSMNFDNVSLESVTRRLSFIPAAGLAAGDAGSFWGTDLDVNNPTDGPMTYYLWWLPRGEDNTSPVMSDLFTLAAGEGRRHVNVLSTAFGLNPDDAPFGALAIAADGAGAFAMARIFNQPDAGGGGTYGQSIPGVSAKGLIAANQRRRILFMTENDDFRSNLGCQNGSAANLRVNMEIFDASGASQGLTTMDLPPYSNGQINRILRDWAPIDGYVDVWSTTPDAAFFCYGSVLDSVSSDPTTVLPQ